MKTKFTFLVVIVVMALLLFSGVALSDAPPGGEKRASSFVPQNSLKQTGTTAPAHGLRRQT